MMERILNPKKIEEKSFEIIDALLPNLNFKGKERKVVKRVIHATACLDYANDLLFHPQAVESGLGTIKKGRNIIVDTNMVKVGINKKMLSDFGCKVICFLDDKDIIEGSLQLKLTRSVLTVRKAVTLMNEGIVVIGNAPTALFEVCDLVKKGMAKPSLIIGIPVGFVGAKESKKELRDLNIPYITNKSRYGGSSVAAACVNALLKIAEGEKDAHFRRNSTH